MKKLIIIACLLFSTNLYAQSRQYGFGIVLTGYENTWAKGFSNSENGAIRFDKMIYPGIVLSNVGTTWEHELILPIGNMIEKSSKTDGVNLSAMYAGLYSYGEFPIRAFLGPVVGVDFFKGKEEGGFNSIIGVRAGAELGDELWSTKAFIYAGPSFGYRNNDSNDTGLVGMTLGIMWTGHFYLDE